MRIKQLLICFAFILISCNEEIPVLKQKIFFEKHYVNMAWIPQSTGFLIDSTGIVRQFSWVEVSHSWYDPDSSGHVSSVNMDKNISYCQSGNRIIQPDTLKEYVDEIYAASKGTISMPEHVMADAGTTTYSAFIFNEKTNQYKQVLLKTDGDISITNSSPAAVDIYQWMKRIGN